MSISISRLESARAEAIKSRINERAKLIEFKELTKQLAALSIDRELTCYCGKKVFSVQASDYEVGFVQRAEIVQHDAVDGKVFAIRVTVIDENGFTKSELFATAQQFFQSSMYLT